MMKPPTFFPRWTALLAVLLATACASTAPTYYSLADNAPLAAAFVPVAAPAGPGAAPARLAIEVAPVAMPERFARPQLVVRQKGAADSAQVDILEQHRWASSFEDELRDALASGIAGRLAAVDASRSPAPRGHPVVRIAVQMNRFDAAQGASVDASFAWTLRRADNEAVSSCRLSLSEAVGTGIEAVAAGARRVSSRLGEAIARSVEALQSGRTACAG